MQDFCDYRLSDKILFLNESNMLVESIHETFGKFGKIHKFKKVCMKKFLVQFDDERVVMNFSEAKKRSLERVQGS